MGYYALVLSCLLASCEEEIQDTVAPDISITSPMLDNKLWLDVSVKADVTDDHLVSKVEFYLDDELLGEDTEAPYELDFNSKQYEDGMYELKVLAYDGGGNQTEASREIEIFNSLLKVSVGDNYASEDLERWIVIADEEGNSIDFAMIENSSEILIDRPNDMENDKFNVMMISRYTSLERREQIYISEYHNISPSSWTLGISDDIDNLGTAVIRHTYSNEHEMYVSGHNISITDGSYSYDYENDSISRTFSLLIHKTPASTFVSTYDIYDNDEAPKYVFINNLKIDSEYNLSQNDFTEMKVGQNTTLPVNDSYSISIYGVTDEDVEYRLYTNFINENTTNLVTYIPKDGFKNYNYRLGLAIDQYRYYKVDKGMPSNSYEMPSLNFEIIDNTHEYFSATVDYEGDFSTNVWSFSEYNQADLTSKSIFRNVYTGIEDRKIEMQLMEIPAKILEEYPLMQNHLKDLNYSYSSINNYSGFDSLDDYIELSFGHYNKPPSYEYITIYPDNSDARLSGKQLPKYLIEEKIRRGETW